MKPALTPATLKAALVLVGTILLAVGSAPELAPYIGARYLSLIQSLGGVLAGMALLKRPGDYAPDEVTVVEGERVSVRPPVE